MMLGLIIAAALPMTALALQERAAPRDPDDPAAGLLAGCGDVPEVVALVENLQIRRDRMAKALQNLDDRRAEIETARAALKAELDRLSAARERQSLSRTRDQQEVAADADRIVALYQAMKPRDAAAVISSLPEEFAAELLIRIHPDSGARIVAAIAPEKAAVLTTYMGARSAGNARER
ncbi:MotE family protein [Paracoccus isoporae]|nr:hypothetical protein [Paracoccus isoporae]